MFGQNDKHHDDNKIPDHSIDGALKDDQNHPAPNEEKPSWQHPGSPIDDNKSESDSPPNEVVKPEGSSVNQGSNPSNQVHETADQHSTVHLSDSSSADELIDIKQKALSELTPLVGHLDQSPEDKFRTTMMMIQASDDQSLVRTAYNAAQKIEDEKARAQALLDIVNEINYFTQHQG